MISKTTRTHPKVNQKLSQNLSKIYQKMIQIHQKSCLEAFLGSLRVQEPLPVGPCSILERFFEPSGTSKPMKIHPEAPQGRPEALQIWKTVPFSSTFFYRCCFSSFFSRFWTLFRKLFGLKNLEFSIQKFYPLLAGFCDLFLSLFFWFQIFRTLNFIDFLVGKR